MSNTDLLHRTLEDIRAHQENWSQIDYRRGAKGCFALHAALLAGGELAHPDPVVPGSSGGEPRLNHDPHLVWNHAAQRLGFARDDHIHLRAFARRALGLTPEQAKDVFDAGNSLADLERLVEQYTRLSE